MEFLLPIGVAAPMLIHVLLVEEIVTEIRTAKGNLNAEATIVEQILHHKEATGIKERIVATLQLLWVSSFRLRNLRVKFDKIQTIILLKLYIYNLYN